MTTGGFPHEVPTPNNQDPLAKSHQELRGRSAHRSRSGVGSHHTLPELHLRSHCQAFWRHASPPSTPDQSWKRRPGLPNNRWVDQLRRDNNNTPPADLWRRSTTRGHLGVTLRSSTTTRWRRRRHRLEVKHPALTPARGRYSIYLYLSRRDGKLS